MIIIGVDFHPEFQQIASMETSRELAKRSYQEQKHNRASRREWPLRLLRQQQ